MLEVKVSYDHDPERAMAGLRLLGRRWRCRPTASRALTTRSSCERLAADPAVRAESRFIVSGDPAEVADRVAPYVAMGFAHLVFHSPAADQERFLREFGAEVLPVLRDRFG